MRVRTPRSREKDTLCPTNTVFRDKQRVRVTVRDAAGFGVEGARGGRQAGFVEGPERWQRRAEHRAAPFDEPVLVAGFVVGEIIDARWAAERGDDAARYEIGRAHV